jgi:mRNA-degrading endonuclease RelE of RelBE toxin-antitoxin system
MKYKILPTREFVKDFKKIDSFMQKRVKEKIEEASENPERYKHMHYDFSGSIRIRIGKLRIILSYSIREKEIYPEKIIFDHKY